MTETRNSEDDKIIRNAARMLFLSLNRAHFESAEYLDLYKKYKQNPKIERYLYQMSEELELDILKITDQGIFIAPKTLSFFATRAKDISIAKSTQEKHILGLILLGLIAFLFPSIRFIEDENYDGFKFTIKAVDEFIRTSIEEVRRSFPSYEQNPDQEHPKLVPLLFKYLQIKYDKGILEDRSTTRYYIQQVLNYLIKQRFIVHITNTEEYHPTSNFKFHVSRLITDENLIELLKLKGDDFNASD